jgi:hypothetical protein
MSQMKTHTMMAAKIITALRGVTFNFAGVYWFGIEGIVIAGVLFSVSYFFGMVVLSKKAGESLACTFENSGSTRATAVVPITTEAYPLPTKCPKDSRLSTARFTKQFWLVMPHWDTGVRLCMEELLADEVHCS